MDYKHRICFRTDDIKTLRFLDSIGIKYKVSDGSIISYIEILESNPEWPIVERYFKGKRLSTGLVDTVYTKEEMNSAEWFTVRSKWRWEYPQPNSGDNGYMKNITYTDSACPECGSGAVQIGNFRVRKSPKWGQKAFLMLNWIGDVLFLSDHAKDILTDSDLSGFHFAEVLNTKGTAAIADIHQLCVDNVLSPGIVWDNDTIGKVNYCSVCGITKYGPTGRGKIYRRSAFEDVDQDIIMSAEVFGWDHLSQRSIIVSKHFYKVINENGLNKQLSFEPIQLV